MNIPANYYIFKINILKKIFLIILGISLIALPLGQKGFFFGFLIGSLLSMAIFLLLYKYVIAINGLELAKRKNFLITRSLLIYILMGLALFIGIKKGVPVFLGTAAGLLTLKIAIFIQVFRERHASA